MHVLRASHASFAGLQIPSAWRGVSETSMACAFLCSDGGGCICQSPPVYGTPAKHEADNQFEKLKNSTYIPKKEQVMSPLVKNEKTDFEGAHSYVPSLGMCTSCADDVQLRERRGRGRSMHVSRRRRRINSRRSVGTAFAIRIRSSIKTGCKAQGAHGRVLMPACAIAMPCLAVGLEGLGGN